MHYQFTDIVCSGKIVKTTQTLSLTSSRTRETNVIARVCWHPTICSVNGISGNWMEDRDYSVHRLPLLRHVHVRICSSSNYREAHSAPTLVSIIRIRVSSVRTEMQREILVEKRFKHDVTSKRYIRCLIIVSSCIDAFQLFASLKTLIVGTKILHITKLLPKKKKKRDWFFDNTDTIYFGYQIFATS